MRSELVTNNRIRFLVGIAILGASFAGCDGIPGGFFPSISSVQLFDEPDFTVAFEVENAPADVAKVNWVFGDGSGFVEGPAGRTTISYQYLATGSFQVTAYIFDSEGNVNQIMGTVDVAPTGNGPDAPTETELPGQIANANPVNGAQNINVAVKLTWTVGARANSHDVYLGLSESDVSSASNTTAGIFRANQTSTLFNPGGLTPGTTYFWRIDEVNTVGTTKGTVRSFTTAEAPEKAETPVPGNSSANARVDQVLSWTAGERATSHDVYFGLSFADVDNATTASADIFQRNQTGTTFDPEDENAVVEGELVGSTQYFWRVDEVGAGGKTKGDVWAFTTRPPPPPIDTPDPPDLDINVRIDKILSWNAPSSVESYDVYLGLDSGDVTNADRTSPEFQGNQTAKIFDPPSLQADVAYFWRIDTRGPGGTTTGTVLTFQTAAPPPPVVGPFVPANDNLDVNVRPTLSWNSGGGLTESFDVYLSTNQNAVATSAGSALQGNQAVGMTTFEVVTNLAANSDIFWKIDAVGPGGKTSGPILRFHTAALPSKATMPMPAHGATGVDVAQNLSWTAGTNATSHDVYFGTNQSAVQNANHDSFEFKGNQPGTNFMPVGGLSANTQYFWRIDEVGSGGTRTGDIWNFRTGPGQALNPQPTHTATDVAITTNLSWSAGAGASTHEVYLGTVEMDVENATPSTPGIFRASQAGTTFNPAEDLEFDTSYFWRIDEVASDGVTRTKGVVWTFTTTPGTKATNPIPAHQATEVALNALLEWTAGNNADMHRVFLGTDPAIVGNAVDGDPEDKGDFGVTFFDPVLAANTIYYWRIDEVATGGMPVVKGDVWRFTTVTPPAQVSGQNPTSGATGISVNPTLTWSAAARATSYDVYFISQAENALLPPGAQIDAATTADAPPFVGNQMSTSRPFNGLTANTTYLWRVDSRNDAGATTGLVFSFKTAP
jgi:PKD domain-containing protein